MNQQNTEQQMRNFLRRHYKAERFEGRDGAVWGNYSEAVIRSHLNDLNANGEGYISRHESASGHPVKYTAASLQEAA